MRRGTYLILLAGAVTWTGCNHTSPEAAQAEVDSLKACAEMASSGFRPIANTRDVRFLGKVQPSTALCRGGTIAQQFQLTPWVDWANYWGAGDASSLTPAIAKKAGVLTPDERGITGALMDLEYERVELIKFNLFDNTGTYPDYVKGRKGVDGPALKTWKEMRLPAGHPEFRNVEVKADGEQTCKGDAIRGRTLTGICNDIFNPLMGSSGMLFARNMPFDSTFPDLGRTELARNRHGDRLGLLKPDPQLVSRKLFTRPQSNPGKCNDGYGTPGFSKDADCDYTKASFFNVLAAFWIQFMTHDWFSHLEEGHNAPEYMKVGCDTPEAQKLGCRPEDRIDKSYVAQSSEPGKFTDADQHLAKDSPGRKQQEDLVKSLREVYGQHTCDASKVITDAQRNADGSAINDCLGHPNGSMVDNVEDVDTVVGWLAESTRPHGYAISETQFVVFILNASRRLFSDRFFTSSFRPEFYTRLGVEWVTNNGPGPKQMEQGKPNGHEQPVSPLKRVLLRTIPELQPELASVVNVFDPWARDRGTYYTLDWKPRPGAESDEAFKK